MPSHERFYERAELYDIAFSFKDVPGECDFLVGLAERHLGRPPESFLEVAAGPATHARELARRGIAATTLDLSPEMTAYAGKLAREEGIPLTCRQGDMTDFALEKPVDMAAILMDSTSYLLDNDAVLRHLECVANALVPGGLYVLEMGHPRDVFRVGKSAGTDWDMTRDDITVSTKWGEDDDPFDPVTQITETTLTVKWERGEDRGEFTETAPQRGFGPNEFRALVTASGRFDLVAEHGAMDAGVPLDNEKPAWRMIPVMRRR